MGCRYIGGGKERALGAFREGIGGWVGASCIIVCVVVNRVLDSWSCSLVFVCLQF